jgi:hypothetical protein
MTDRDPLELPVLGALTSGVESPSTVAARIGATREDVAVVLDREVVEGLVTRLDLAGTPVYSLTPKGREVVGVVAEAPDPRDEHGHIDDGPETSYVVARHEEPQDVPEDHVLRGPGPKQVKWRHVVYAVAYVVLGLFFLVFLHTVVGLFAVVAGVVIGGVALRPLLRTADARVTTR